MLAGHTLADDFGVLVDEDFGLLSGLVAASLESEDLRFGSKSLDGFIQHTNINY